MKIRRSHDRIVLTCPSTRPASGGFFAPTNRRPVVQPPRYACTELRIERVSRNLRELEVRARTHVRRVLPAGTLTARRGLPANVVFAAALSMAFFTADLFIPLALTSVRGISATLAVILTTVPVPVGTGLAGALVATMGATAAGLSGVLVVAGAGVVLALLAPTRFAETHPPLTPPER